MRFANCLLSAAGVVFLAGVCHAADLSASGPQTSEQTMPVAPSDPGTPPSAPNETPISVDSVSASTAYADAPTRITLTGAGFGPGTRVALHEGGMAKIGEYHHRGAAYSNPSPIAVKDRLVFLGNLSTYSLEVLDIQDPAAPRRIGELRNFYAGDLVAGPGVVYARMSSDVLAVDVRDPSHPVRCGAVSGLPSGPLAMTVIGHTLYIPTSYNGIAIHDATDACHPTLAGTIPMDSRYGRYLPVVANGEQLLAVYTWSNGQELQVFDASEATSPVLVATLDLAPIGGVSSIAASGKRVYLASSSSSTFVTIRVADLSDPRSPALLPVSDPDPVYASQIAVCGDVVYTAGGVSSIDVSDPSHPREMPSTARINEFARDPIAVDDFVVVGIPDGIATARTPARPPLPPPAFFPLDMRTSSGVVTDGGRLYIENMTGSPEDPERVTVFDVTEPSAPRHDPTWTFEAPPRSGVIAAAGRYAYFRLPGSIRILDVTDPTNPVTVGEFAIAPEAQPQLAGNLILVFGWDGIHIVDISDPTQPTTRGVIPGPIYDPVWTLDGATLYFMDVSGVLHIVDLSDPTSPRELGSVRLSPISPHSLFIREGLLFGDGAMVIVDIRDASAPRVLASYPRFAIRDAVALDGILYGALYDSLDLGGLDLRDPSRPTVTAVIPSRGWPSHALNAGYLLSGNWVHGLATYRPPQPLRVVGPVTDTSLTFEIPAGYPPGSYHVAAEQPDGTTARLLNAIQVVANRPPIAEAGPDQVLECTGNLQAAATLDGSASTDTDSTPGTDDDITSFDWSEGGVSLATGVTATVPLRLGAHDVTLTVTDKAGATGTDDTLITVRDTIPPVGAVTSPAEGRCFGPSTIPVMVTDNFQDVCDPTILRTYSPPPGPLYPTHGDHHVVVTAMDTSGNAATAAVDFTIDIVPPVVQLLSPSQNDFVLPRGLPFAIRFKDGDDDGATGGVVHEVVKLQGCPIYDGSTYGNRDGLLSDETLQLDSVELCRIAAQCGFTELVNPELRVEATDCGGNVGFAGETLPGSIRLLGGICGHLAVPSTRAAPGSSMAPRGSPKRGTLSRT